MNWKLTVVRHRSRIVWIALIVLLVLYVSVRVITLDAYEQCHKPANLGLCFDAWMNIDGMHTPFKNLMTDEEMIDRLQKHRPEFEAIVSEAQQTKRGGGDVLPKEISDQRWLVAAGIEWINRDRNYTKGEIVCLQPLGPLSANCQRRAWKWKNIELRADVTRIIDARLHPFSNLVKYYVYYPWEEPAFEGDRIYAWQPTESPPTRNTRWMKGRAPLILLVDSLDKGWPESWLDQHQSPYCLMRRIDTHWYLKLCKNDIGG